MVNIKFLDMKKFQLIRLVIAGVTLLIILSSCAYTSQTAERILNNSKDKAYDIIVVPGVPFELTQGKWSMIMKARVYWSKFLFDRGIAKNIMYSGSAVYTPYCEAEIMAMYAEALGIPKENIYVETKAEHSTENIYYSYKKARQLGFSRIALATDPFQSKMLKKFIEKRIHPEVGIVPIVFDTIRVMDATLKEPDIDYNKAHVSNFVSIEERENFWTRFKGTRGKKIDDSLYQ